MRGYVKNVIIGTLECDNFDEDDFTIRYDVNKAIIRYDYSDLEYKFIVNIPDERTEVEKESNVMGMKLGNRIKKVYFFEGQMNPGRYSACENFECRNLKELKEELNSWKKYLFGELSSSRTNLDNGIENRTHSFDFEYIEKYIDENIADEMFSCKEIEELNNKLNEVQSKFEEELKNIISDQEKLKEELNKVKKDFSKLKTASTIMAKRDWCKKYTRKIKDFLSDEEKRATTLKVLKGGNMFLKIFGMEIPMLGEGIETMEEVANSID
ncbi:hypothetical protein [Anaeromicrobium sediminis]|uniref:Uncharacterized protein n=1 Tax=Anaeromicrobium sediminis TaxID=1478221 RepID=A0A267MPQ4_9FIRM|nr:hypothetical protein [Anaeromicrobium sediminis]PAB60878.1 hypothetical protein CCE28_00140 [Anaeromicrobium sediminis]